MFNLEKYSFATLNATVLFCVMLLLGLVFENHSDDFHWSAYVSMCLFYGVIFFAGVIASASESKSPREMILAGRNLPLGIALMTMTATWVGGGFINGTAESVYSFGLAWAQAPWGYAISLIIGGLFFAEKMRSHNFTTMLDPIQQRYGNKMTALLYLPALTGELFWTGAILTALGTTFGALLGIDATAAILFSSFIAILYTSLGGLRAVALTDVLQLIILIVGLWLTVPFLLPKNTNLLDIYSAYEKNMGSLAGLFPPLDAFSDPNWGNYTYLWFDYALLLVFGGIPWHVYFQRVLSAKDPKTARNLSLGAGFFCILAALPAVLVGMIGNITDWTALGVPEPESSAIILPHTLKYLAPGFIATIGLGALAAAVMSSADSSILSASSMGTWNIIKPKFLKDKENLAPVIKRFIWVIGISATLIAIKVKSVYSLWFLCSDFVYCIFFPQLLLALYDKKANTAGSAAGFLVAFILRFGAGEPTLGISAIIEYPMIDETGASSFPFRTTAMLSSLTTIFLVSRLTQKKFPPVPLTKVA